MNCFESVLLTPCFFFPGGEQGGGGRELWIPMGMGTSPSLHPPLESLGADPSQSVTDPSHSVMDPCQSAMDPSQSVADPSQSAAGLSNVLLIRPKG